MRNVKYLLVGGGLGAGAAAKMIRDRDPEGAITIVTEEAHPPYQRPPLSKEYLRGEAGMEKLIVLSLETAREKRIEILTNTAVTKLHPAEKRVTIAGGDQIGYEKLLLATGGRAIRPPIPGSDLTGVHYFRTVGDADAMIADAVRGKRAVMVGAGFIGIEVAASLTQMGVEVTVIESQAHIWSRFLDETLAHYFESYCADRGIRFLTSDQVTELRGVDRISAVVTKSGTQIPCDFACIAVGIRPNVELAQEAGLSVDNGVVVDEHMQTSDAGIYAIGDIANYPDPIYGVRRRVEHYGQAEYTGQLAGMNMTGDSQAYDMLTYVWSDIFDLHLEFAGDESRHDEVILRGEPAGNSFTVLYLAGGVMTAYFAINAEAKDFPVYKRLIRQRIDLSAKVDQLRDPSSNLRQLLMA